VVGSSLTARIVALAYGFAAGVSLMPPQQGGHPDKRMAFADTWEPASVPRCVAASQIEHAVMQALAVSASVLQENRPACGRCYRPKSGAVGWPAQCHESGRPDGLAQ